MNFMSRMTQSIQNIIKNITRKSLKTRRVLSAYNNQDYEGAVNLLATMDLAQFENEMLMGSGDERVTLIHHCANESNLECM
jgi:hypothetical protein